MIEEGIFRFNADPIIMLIQSCKATDLGPRY